MKATKKIDTGIKLTVDLDGLKDMLQCGKSTAWIIGKEAKARIKIGRRVLYNVNKVQDYLEKSSN